MPVIMTQQRNPVKFKQIKEQISKELNFLKNVFATSGIYSQMKGEVEENVDYEMVVDQQPDNAGKEVPKRARSIMELEEKLQKIKSQSNFNLKNKLAKKSLSSKLNKKIKKTERLKTRVKGKPMDKPLEMMDVKVERPDEKPKVNLPKPIFNNEGKLVFSKFDFSNVGRNSKQQKGTKDPKKLLENLKQQEQRFQKLEETHQEEKVKQIKEKMAWKNILDKAEGQKIKDDPILLKKSIKKTEQKKKQSKNQWDNRVMGVQQKKDDRQKKRKENILNKKKEKKSKIVKAAVKRGRVVI